MRSAFFGVASRLDKVAARRSAARDFDCLLSTNRRVDLPQSARL
jgi:hypothetical protein